MNIKIASTLFLALATTITYCAQPPSICMQEDKEKEEAQKVTNFDQCIESLIEQMQNWQPAKTKDYLKATTTIFGQNDIRTKQHWNKSVMRVKAMAEALYRTAKTESKTASKEYIKKVANGTNYLPTYTHTKSICLVRLAGAIETKEIIEQFDQRINWITEFNWTTFGKTLNEK